MPWHEPLRVAEDASVPDQVKQRLHSTVDPTALASLKQAVAFFNRQAEDSPPRSPR